MIVMDKHECMYGEQIEEIYKAVVGTADKPGMASTVKRLDERLEQNELSVEMVKLTIYGGNGNAVGLCERLRSVERIYGAVWRATYVLSGAAGMGLLASLAAYLKGWI